LARHFGSHAVGINAGQDITEQRSHVICYLAMMIQGGGDVRPMADSEKKFPTEISRSQCYP
jgi:hypothetical protein